MNERIQELATRAGMVIYPTGLGVEENTLWGDKNIEQFAKLIVQECITTIEQDRFRISNEWDFGTAYDDGYVDGMGRAEHILKEHFGAKLQRPWVGLTDEEAKEIYSRIHGYDSDKRIAIAIEAKLKEKNKGQDGCTVPLYTTPQQRKIMSRAFCNPAMPDDEDLAYNNDYLNE